MTDALLSSIEWHDLPVSAIRIEESGLSLVVTPYNALAGAYDTRILRITDAEHVGIRMTGTLTAEDFRSMEVSTFDYSVGPPVASPARSGCCRERPGTGRCRSPTHSGNSSMAEG